MPGHRCHPCEPLECGQCERRHVQRDPHAAGAPQAAAREALEVREQSHGGLLGTVLYWRPAGGREKKRGADLQMEGVGRCLEVAGWWVAFVDMVLIKR